MLPSGERAQKARNLAQQPWVVVHLSGAHAFCRLRSVLSTWRKQGRSVLAALEILFSDPADQPLKAHPVRS